MAVASRTISSLPSAADGDPLGSGWPRWVIPVLFAVLMLSFALPRVWPNFQHRKQPFSTFWTQVEDGKVKSVVVNNSDQQHHRRVDDR